MQYRHLLVPVDLVEPLIAVEVALQMATEHHSHTTLLYVIQEIDRDAPDDDLRDWYAEIESSIAAQLEQLARQFERSGLTVEREILVGRPVRDIVNYSATRSVDLILMNSDRIDLNQPDRGIGSLSHQVSVFCQCPVMLIK